MRGGRCWLTNAAPSLVTEWYFLADSSASCIFLKTTVCCMNYGAVRNNKVDEIALSRFMIRCMPVINFNGPRISRP